MALEMAGFWAGMNGHHLLKILIIFCVGRRRFLYVILVVPQAARAKFWLVTPYVAHFGPWTVFEQR